MSEYAGKGRAKLQKISEKKNIQTSSGSRPGIERVNSRIRKRRAAVSAATFGDTTTKPDFSHHAE
jgi:hypothetical protein